MFLVNADGVDNETVFLGDHLILCALEDEPTRPDPCRAEGALTTECHARHSERSGCSRACVRACVRIVELFRARGISGRKRPGPRQWLPGLAPTHTDWIPCRNRAGIHAVPVVFHH